LDGDGFGEVAGFVNVAAAGDGEGGMQGLDGFGANNGPGFDGCC